MEGNASIATDMLVKAEKQEATKEALIFIGSYASVVMPNFTSVPLKRKKKILHVQEGTIPETKCSPSQHYEVTNCDKVNNFHSAKDEKQLLRQMDQVFDYINIKSPKTIIGYGHKLVKVLKEKQNEQHLLLFLKTFNFKLRHEHFIPGKWYKNSLNDTCSKLAQDTELASLWTELLAQVNLTPKKGEPDHQGTREMFQIICKKFCKRRCITFLAIDQLNPKKEEQKSAIHQMLQAFEMKTSHIKKRCNFKLSSA